MKSAYCVNLGCSENHLDGSLIDHYLKSNDWELADSPEDADLIIVNSCGFKEEMERRSINTYQEMMSLKRPDARVIFAGCLPAINKQAVQNAGYEDVLVTPRTLHLLDSVTNASTSIDVPDKVPAEVAQKRVKLLRRLEWINFFRAYRWFPMRPSYARKPETQEKSGEMT